MGGEGGGQQAGSQVGVDGAAQQLRLSLGRHDLPISQHAVWERPWLCWYRPQTRGQLGQHNWGNASSKPGGES